MSQESRIVYSFPKNALEEVRVSLSNYKGKQYVDMRIYYKTDDGDFHPSKKGITFPPDLFPELEEAVNKLRTVLSE